MATQAQVTNFINTIGPLAAKVCKERGLGNAQIWTCISQACCESAYGTSKLMKNANAFFGIKASAAWVKTAKYGGKVYNSKTSECYDGKTYTQITACFRAYNSMEDSIRDYFDLLSAARYKKSLKEETVEACITDIKNGGYATSPTYINTICTIYTNNKALIEKYTVGNTTSVVQTAQKTETKTTTSTTSSGDFQVGDKVRMTVGAPVYGTSRKFSSWVYSATLYIREIAGNKIVVSTLKTGAVTGPVDKKYLTKIK